MPITGTVRNCVLLAFLATAAPVAAHVRIIDFDLYGKQPNLCPPVSPGGVCAAASAINSFIYLQNRFPEKYGDRIVPNIEGTMPNQTSELDTLAFADLYYGTPGVTDWRDHFMATKKKWLEGKAPGKTRYSSQYPGSTYVDSPVDLKWLYHQIRLGEDVEFFVSWTCEDGKGGTTICAHAMTLFGVDLKKGEIHFQDPNDPTKPLVRPIGPGMTFKDIPSLGDIEYTIYAAFSESPIPEPATWALLIAGFGLVGTRLRQRTRAAVA